MALMVSISGVRGIVGESLTPSVVVSFISAFGALQNGKVIVIGRDSRESGEWISSIARGVLVAQGYEVLETGVVPTPTVQVLVEKYKADGGLIVTSSHNPEPWNGLKFVDRDGCFLSPEGCETMFSLVRSGAPVSYCNYERVGKIVNIDDALDQHIEAIFKLDYLNLPKIQEKKFKVCLDSVNGAGGPVMQKLLQRLGCEVVGLNLEPTGKFAHMPEPIPAHLGDLCKSVAENKADLGIAVDPDVDRCVLIDETGKPLGEEYTLALAVEFILGKCGKTGTVVKNLSSSRATDDIAKKYGQKVLATAVGEINVAKKMQEVKSVIGGEGNGGVMLTEVHIGRDALVAAVLTLQHLALVGGTIGQLKASLPQYEIVKLKVGVEGIDAEKALKVLGDEWEGKAELNREDGLRIDFVGEKQEENWWVHLRKSNTEPIIRVIGEASTADKATQICQGFMDKIVTYKI
eukprot:TRINITY_DN388_c0_g1_i1.p1 TRINITY_DN388_c0_g1~~TRINITY_DN388_c0_g1_i1.p1  ORF type:complete len:461 (+),score=122.17 TRINITY_DN388_c0_g1_i1:51-1433(+)